MIHTVEGSWVSFGFDDHGNVYDCNHDRCDSIEYANTFISKVDVDDLLREYPIGLNENLPESFDSLDVGYWHTDGVYTPADWRFRRDARRPEFNVTLSQMREEKVCRAYHFSRGDGAKSGVFDFDPDTGIVTGCSGGADFLSYPPLRVDVEDLKKLYYGFNLLRLRHFPADVVGFWRASRAGEEKIIPDPEQRRLARSLEHSSEWEAELLERIAAGKRHLRERSSGIVTVEETWRPKVLSVGYDDQSEPP